MNDIVLNNISKTYGNKLALPLLSCKFPKGETSVILGASGCGKTTLFRLLMGFEKPDSGTIVGLDEARISSVFQEDRLLPAFSVLTNVRVIVEKYCADDSIVACLQAMGLGDVINLPARTLSGGMKRRVAIARALLYPFDVLLLDEPFKGLDEVTKERVASFVREQCLGKTLLCITHDIHEAEALGGQIINLGASNSL